MEPLFLFVKEMPSVMIFEMKNNVVPDEAPKSLKYQWFIMRDKKIMQLHFKEQGTTDGIVYRRFDEGTLAWNEETKEAGFLDNETGETINRLERCQ